MSSPFGRVQRASVRPTGSGSSAIASSPAAIASNRFGSSARRSRSAGARPLALGLGQVARVGGEDFRRVRAHRSGGTAQRLGLDLRRASARAAAAARALTADLGHLARQMQGSAGSAGGAAARCHPPSGSASLASRSPPDRRDELSRRGHGSRGCRQFHHSCARRCGEYRRLNKRIGRGRPRRPMRVRTITASPRSNTPSTAMTPAGNRLRPRCNARCRPVVDDDHARRLDGAGDPRFARRTRLASRQK